MSLPIEVSSLLINERNRQESLKQQGRFRHTPYDVGMMEPEKLACLMEEVGEIARNVMARSYLVTDGDRNDIALQDATCDRLEEALGQGRR